MKSLKIIFFFLNANCCIALAVGQQTVKGAYPYGFFTPETSLAIGGFGFWMPNFDSTKAQKPSIVQHFITLTAKKQFLFENEWFIYSKNRKWLSTGILDIIKFPELYYGIGNTSKQEDALMLTYNIANFTSKNVYLFRKNWYVGPQVMFYKLWNIEGEDLEKINMSNSKMPEIESFITVGAGAVLIFDSRNHQLNPSKGFYFETQTNLLVNYSSPFGQTLLDMRLYKSTVTNLTFASQFYAHFNQGDVPFRLMPTLGGGRFLRGFYRGRYRDKNMLVLQGEMRYKIYKRFGAALFSGIGQVASSATDFSSRNIHFNYGAGLRYQLKKNDPANLRFDLGFTKEGAGFYILFAESF